MSWRMWVIGTVQILMGLGLVLLLLLFLSAWLLGWPR